MASQYFGAKHREGLSQTIGSCITLTTILGVFIMVVGPFVTRPILTFLQTPPEVLDDSVTYMNILLLGVLGAGFFNILSGVLRAVGDPFSPLLYLALASILNIVLNFILIGFLGWGVAGAAIGTVLSQAFSSLLCLRRLMQMRNLFDTGINYLIPKKQYFSQLLKLGGPTSASQAIFAMGMMAVQPLANSFGPVFLAANVIVMRVDGFVMMPNFSFGNAMSVFAGQNTGAGKLDRVRQGTKQCLQLTIASALILITIILVFGRQIAGLFTDTEEVLMMSVRFLRILAVGYLAFGINVVLLGAIRGSGDAIIPMWISIINTIAIKIPSAYLLVHFIGEPAALIYALLTAWVVNSLITFFVYRIGKWRNKGIVKEKPTEKPTGTQLVENK